MTSAGDCSVFHALDEEAQLRVGAALAAALRGGELCYLRGDLGAGKTTLSRGLLRALGHSGAVKSPTYTLVESYSLALATVHHFDLYRVQDPMELEDFGLRDYLDGTAIVLVEWPERGDGALPDPDLDITIRAEGVGRRISVLAHSARGDAALDRLKQEWQDSHCGTEQA
jgi:tRNA threonylcarbamoyladenosine biosynthesis protein TsaE